MDKKDMFDGKIVLITGGTGSFGSTVLSRFLNSNVEEVRIFSRDEKKQDEIRNRFSNKKLKLYIGDVRDPKSLNDALRNVDYVFHAAALKQVPSCEFFPMEAIKTNVVGTENVLDCAISNQVKKVVLLSTDKAVHPVNAMGMSKALAEKILISKSRHESSAGTVLCATRYGNVMASRGSVIPLFIDQIRKNKALTITDPNMTRFLMSLEESVELVLYAFQHGRQGDLFVQKSPGASVGDLAQAIKEIFGSNQDDLIIGTRHGEKKFETLVSQEEMLRAEDLGQYFRIAADNRDLNYSSFFSEGEKLISDYDDYTSHNTERLSVLQIRQLLLSLDYVKGRLDA